MAPQQAGKLDKASEVKTLPKSIDKIAHDKSPAHQNSGAIKQHEHNGSTHKSSGQDSGHKKPAIKVETEVEEAPVTQERKVFVRQENDKLTEPGVGRVNIAATKDVPKGTTKDGWASKHKHQTVMQQHCDFFDRDHDGIIWPQDTFVGFYRLGFGILLSAFAVLVIHLNFAYPTQESWIPDPRLLVHINNIHKDKHGSDTNSYDHEGRFVPQHFEEIFTKYADGRDYLTLSDIGKIWNGQRLLNDFVGMGAAIFEWIATYIMLWPEDGKMWKEDIRGVYDGSIFYTIAARRESKKLQ